MKLFSQATLVVSAWLLLLAGGCSRQGRIATQAPAPAPSSQAALVVAEPQPAAAVYVEDSQVFQAPPPDVPDAVGYETLSTNERVEVVTYVHTYSEPVASYPKVYWSGRWYYNVNGDFVFWSNVYGGWVYYWGPPPPLVVTWNYYYPWAPFAWGVGFYGPGWYWGGVGVYGYHAYGLPVTHHHHHHHHHWNDDRGRHPDGRRPQGKGKPVPGRDRDLAASSPGRGPGKPGRAGGRSRDVATAPLSGATPAEGPPARGPSSAAQPTRQSSPTRGSAPVGANTTLTDAGPIRQPPPRQAVGPDQTPPRAPTYRPSRGGAGAPSWGSPAPSWSTPTRPPRGAAEASPPARAPTWGSPPQRKPTSYSVTPRHKPAPSYSPPRSQSPPRRTPSAAPSRAPTRSASPPRRAPTRSASPPRRAPARSSSPPSQRSRSAPARGSSSRGSSRPSRSSAPRRGPRE